MKLQVQQLGLKGIFTIEHRDSTGKILDKFDIDNTVTTVGKAGVASLLQGGTSARYRRIALDASSTVAKVGNTTLASEIISPSLARVLSTNTIVTTTVTNDTSQLVHTFNSTATQSVYGVGVFNTASAGTLISRTTFAAKNLVSGDSLTVTHKLIIS